MSIVLVVNPSTQRLTFISSNPISIQILFLCACVGLCDSFWPPSIRLSGWLVLLSLSLCRSCFTILRMVYRNEISTRNPKASVVRSISVFLFYLKWTKINHRWWKKWNVLPEEAQPINNSRIPVSCLVSPRWKINSHTGQLLPCDGRYFVGAKDIV